MIIEYFEFDLTYEDHLWRKLEHEASFLSEYGISAVWMPPAFKGCMGRNDSGYGVYDLYDLGEFDQKWTVPTKYGTIYDYLSAISALHRKQISVYADIVMNHRMGADDVNVAKGVRVREDNRNKKIGIKRSVCVPTQFNCNNRKNKYSAFKWTADHFTGADYDAITGKKGIYLLNGKNWSQNVSKEKGNFDYLMGANVDVNQKDVRAELMRFGHWYSNIAQLEGYRLDALKHIDHVFIRDWLKEMRTQGTFFAMGEYWSGSADELQEYLRNTESSMSLFDVPLHYHFEEACRNKNTYDLRNLFKDTLTERDPMHSVTFVDNHDTQPGQALQSFVRKWFRPFAYACILLRKDGYPCVFYGDLYGLRKSSYSGIRSHLLTLLRIRQKYARGWQNDHITYGQFGFTREGGLAVLFSLRKDGYERMYVGRQYAGSCFRDLFHRKRVLIDSEGFGEFTCRKESLSVFIPEND